MSAAAKKITAKAKPAAKKPAAKKATAAKKGAAVAAAELAADPKAKAAKVVKPEVEQTVATPELQALAEQRTEIVGELSVANGVVNGIKKKLEDKNQELLEGGALVGMVFEIDGDPMQFTHNVSPSKAYSTILKELGEKHPELATEIEELTIKHTKANQQQPNFKAA
jgi:hypothetical protein